MILVIERVATSRMEWVDSILEKLAKQIYHKRAKNNGLTVTEDPRHLPENSNTRSDHYFQASSNGIVVVTTHLYDGRKSLPLDIELYQHASSLSEGKQDPEFEKKTELALKLIDRTLERKYQPRIVIVDAGYGNNTSFLLELELRELKYLGGLAKNRKVTITQKDEIQQTIRLDELAQSLRNSIKLKQTKNSMGFN